ncbi:MAG TPA: hypothetical protein VJN96_04435 [Vicinamibacterales bacterium]|nr:hypothetical protein [Vicinamibacterales bacterium]
MPTDAATSIAYVGAFVGLVGGGIALFNSRKGVTWKRAELASNYMKDFNNNPELVFASRCLDWNGGKLVIPENLQPYMPDGVRYIEHDRQIFAKAMRPNLQIGELSDDPRIQIYRTSMDSFLSWLSLVSSALGRGLFLVEDLQDVGYWVSKIQSEIALHGFIVSFGYQESLEKLVKFYRTRKSPYRDWTFPTNVVGMRPQSRVEETVSVL